MPRGNLDLSIPVLNLQKRFFLDSDDDGHWYVIPEDMRPQWEEWCESFDEEKMPSFAKPVGGSPSLITFTDPK